MDNVFNSENQIERTLSFSAGVKEEICAQPIKKICCRKALAHGLLFGASNKDEKFTVSVPTEDCADFARGIIKGIFGREADVSNKGRGTLRFFVFVISSY
jgi:hypothetical protein